jgi:hypothetical protein
MVLLRKFNEPRHLSWDAALQVAKLAKIPDQHRELFCVDLCGWVQMVWEWDPRAAVSYTPSNNLKDAANAARALRAALQALTSDDKQWVQRVVAQHIYPHGKPANPLLNLDWTVSVVAQVLYNAVGRGLFDSAPAALSRQRGRKAGSFNDKTFRDLIELILLAVCDYDGRLTFDKNFEKGTLVDVLEFLRPHLPRGVIPNHLPYNTIQKIKTEFSRTHR